MVAIRTIITIAILVALLAKHQTDAVCCGRPEPCGLNCNEMCGSTPVVGRWCCGVGDCNLLCCNCDGGCHTFDNLTIDYW